MTIRVQLLTAENSPVGDILGDHIPRVGEFVCIEGNNASLAVTNYGSAKFKVTNVVYPVIPGPMNAARVLVYVEPMNRIPGDLPEDPAS